MLQLKTILYCNSLRFSVFTHTKPCTTPRTRLLKRFVLKHSVIKTKHLKCLVQDTVHAMELLEILGFRFSVSSRYKEVHDISRESPAAVNFIHFVVCNTRYMTYARQPKSTAPGQTKSEHTLSQIKCSVQI